MPYKSERNVGDVNFNLPGEFEKLRVHLTEMAKWPGRHFGNFRNLTYEGTGRLA